MLPDYRTKFASIVDNRLFSRLPPPQQAFVREISERHRFTLQELRQVIEIALDLEIWGSGSLQQHWSEEESSQDPKQKKKRAVQRLQARWNRLKNEPNHYPAGRENPVCGIKVKVHNQPKSQLGLGFCPVASPRTRCCNLLTLDAVDNCGYQCSYCSIQSFFSDHQVFFDPSFAEKLDRLELDEKQTYHIGTGQSSDSLMWGNSHGVLDALIRFARNHPNVILEMKTKSANITRLLDSELPPNLICTWSLNPQVIIDHEEHGSAPLAKRLESAQRLAQQGTLVGFHFHPLIHYSDWRRDYGEIFHHLQQEFIPSQVAMVSFGTLTFTKSVIRKIRERGGSNQILKMPLVESDGKLSYPDEIKQQLFSFAYRSFSDRWHQSVFFYLCMENQRFWESLFGYDYPSNTVFEQAMKTSYMKKIERLNNPPAHRMATGTTR